MQHSHKVLVNLSSLYVKTIISTVIQLIATRIVLNSLGVDSFGLYNLIAGIIILFSFFNGSLMISTQRFLSIYIGRKDENKLSEIFNASIFVHFILAFIIILFLKLFQPFLFNGFLLIPIHLHETSIKVYNLMIISSFITILTIPYSANINAREDMWFYALSEILVALFKLWAAISLLLFKGDLLYIYTFFILVSVIVGSLAQIIWCKFKYKESSIEIKLMKNKKNIREILGFTGWNTLGSIAVLVRNQGIAVLFNVFFGTKVNAAYGIANQVNSLVLTFATTLTTVFTPSIVQSKGEGNEKKMLSIALFSSKLSFLLSSIVALPLILYMPQILEIWLKEVPDYSIIFCRLIIVSFIISQFYPGLNRAIYAIGKIKGYQISFSIILTSIIPIGCLLFHFEFSPHYILTIMPILQFLALLSTIYFINKYIKLDVKYFFIKSVLVPTFILSIIVYIGFYINKLKFHQNNLIIVSFSLLYCSIYMITYLIFVFSNEEKKILKNITSSIFNKNTNKNLKGN